MTRSQLIFLLEKAIKEKEPGAPVIRLKKAAKKAAKHLIKNTKLAVKDPEKFFTSKEGQTFEAVLDVIGMTVYTLGRNAHPKIALTGLSFLAASLVIDLIQKDYKGLVANILLLTPGFTEMASKGAFGKSVQTADSVNRIKTLLRDSAAVKSIIAASGADLISTDAGKIADRYYSKEKIESMSKKDLLKVQKTCTSLAHALGSYDALRAPVIDVNKRVEKKIRQIDTAEKKKNKNTSESIRVTKKQLIEMIKRELDISAIRWQVIKKSRS